MRRIVLELRALFRTDRSSDRLDICRILERCCARAPGELLPCEKQALQLVLTFFFPISKAELPPSAEVGQVVYQALLDFFYVQENDRFQIFTEHPKDKLALDHDYLGLHWPFTLMQAVAIPGRRSRDVGGRTEGKGRRSESSGIG